MSLDIKKTRVIELIDDGRFDDVLEPMGVAVLRRLKLLKARKERAERLRKRRAKRQQTVHPNLGKKAKK